MFVQTCTRCSPNTHWCWKCSTVYPGGSGVQTTCTRVVRIFLLCYLIASTNILTLFQSSDFREKAVAAQSTVKKFEDSIKLSKMKLLKVDDSEGASTFDLENHLDSLVSLRSLVISSLFEVRISVSSPHLFWILNFSRHQAVPMQMWVRMTSSSLWSKRRSTGRRPSRLCRITGMRACISPSPGLALFRALTPPFPAVTLWMPFLLLKDQNRHRDLNIDMCYVPAAPWGHP